MLRLAFLLLLLISVALALASRFQRYPFKKRGRTKCTLEADDNDGPQDHDQEWFFRAYVMLPERGLERWCFCAHLWMMDPKRNDLPGLHGEHCTLEADGNDGPLDHDQEFFFRAYVMLPERGIDRWCFCAHLWMMDPKRNFLPGLHGEHVIHLNFDEQYWSISPYDNRFEFKPCPYYPIGQPHLYLNDEEKARAKANGTWVAEYDPEYEDPWFAEATTQSP